MIIEHNKKMIIWQFTHKCNYNCSYCFLDKNHIFNFDYNKTIQKLKEIKGTWTVTLTGGEPLYSKDIKKIVEKIINETKHNLEIITNLSLPIEDLIPIINIAKKRLEKITTSLHLEYIDPKVFLKKLLALKEYTNKYGCSLVVNCVALKGDLKRRKSIGNIFKKNNINFILIPECNCFGHKNYYSKKEKKTIKKFGKTFGLFSINFKGRLCSAGKNYFVIDQNGDAHRCYSEINFTPEKSIGKAEDKKFNLFPEPKKCPYPLCMCETPYYMGLIEENPLIEESFMNHLANFLDKYIGVIGISLKKYTPNFITN